MPVITLNTDQDLLGLLNGPNKNIAIGELYKRHLHRVTGLCMYYLHDVPLAQDAVMDIFEGLLRNLDQYEVKNFQAWLMTYTRNHCLKLLTRALKREGELFNKNVDPESVEYADHLDHVDENIYETLDMALDNLKPHQRKCVQLFYLQGKSYAEIASETEWSLKEVKSYLQNGKKNLKKKLGQRLSEA